MSDTTRSRVAPSPSPSPWPSPRSVQPPPPDGPASVRRRRRPVAAVRGVAFPAPLLDGAVVAALIASDLAAQTVASAGTDVSSTELSVVAVLVAAVSAATLWWRRRRPLTVLAAVIAMYPVAAAACEPGLFTQLTGATVVLSVYAVAAWSEHRRWAVAVPCVLVVIAIAGALGDDAGIASAVAVGLALVPLPWALGSAARSRRRYLAEVERRLAAAEQERDAKARRAVLDERAHIARELHDVVAHHISLVGVQAGAARTTLDGPPGATRAALEAIETASRTAVGEMRQLLDTLRDDDRSMPVAPQPGLADLDRLVDGYRRVGIDVALHHDGAPIERPPLHQLCCYRIVEEALTNVARHSTATSAAVRVVHRRDGVRVTVIDAGPARHPPRGGGRGVIGMRERVSLFGGRLSAGPRSEGGFAVVAELPDQRPPMETG